eukprot:gene20063-26782_t
MGDPTRPDPTGDRRACRRLQLAPTASPLVHSAYELQFAARSHPVSFDFCKSNQQRLDGDGMIYNSLYEVLSCNPQSDKDYGGKAAEDTYSMHRAPLGSGVALECLFRVSHLAGPSHLCAQSHQRSPGGATKYGPVAGFDARQTTALITSSHSVADVLTVCRMHQPHLNAIHLSAALTTANRILARSSPTPKGSYHSPSRHGSSLEPDPMEQLVQLVTESLLQGSTIRACRPRELSNICWALAKVHTLYATNPALISALVKTSLLDDGGRALIGEAPQAGANIAWALAQWGVTGPSPAWDALCQVASSQLHLMSAQDLSNYTWAMAKLEFLPEGDLLSQISAQVTWLLQRDMDRRGNDGAEFEATSIPPGSREVTARRTSGLDQASAVPDKRVTKQYGRDHKRGATGESFSPQALSNIVWAVSILRTQGPQSASHVTSHSRTASLTNSGMPESEPESLDRSASGSDSIHSNEAHLSRRMDQQNGSEQGTERPSQTDPGTQQRMPGQGSYRPSELGKDADCRTEQNENQTRQAKQGLAQPSESELGRDLHGRTWQAVNQPSQAEQGSDQHSEKELDGDTQLRFKQAVNQPSQADQSSRTEHDTEQDISAEQGHANQDSRLLSTVGRWLCNCMSEPNDTTSVAEGGITTPAYTKGANQRYRQTQGDLLEGTNFTSPKPGAQGRAVPAPGGLRGIKTQELSSLAVAVARLEQNLLRSIYSVGSPVPSLAGTQSQLSQQVTAFDFGSVDVGIGKEAWSVLACTAASIPLTFWSSQSIVNTLWAFATARQPCTAFQAVAERYILEQWRAEAEALGTPIRVVPHRSAQQKRSTAHQGQSQLETTYPPSRKGTAPSPPCPCLSVFSDQELVSLMWSLSMLGDQAPLAMSTHSSKSNRSTPPHQQTKSNKSSPPKPAESSRSKQESSPALSPPSKLWGALAEAAELRFDNLDPQKVATVMWACAQVKFYHVPLFRKACLYACWDPSRLSVRVWSMLLGACAEVGHVDEALMVGFTKLSNTLLRRAPPKTVAYLCVSAATLGLENPGLYVQAAKLTRTRHYREVVAVHDVGVIISITWAVTKAGFRSLSMLQLATDNLCGSEEATHRQSVGHPDRLRLSSALKLLWATASSRCYCQPMFYLLVQRLLLSLDELSPSALVDVVWSCAATRHYDEALLEGVSKRLGPTALKQLTLDELTRAMWAFASLGAGVFMQWRIPVEALRSRIHELDDRQTALLLWSISVQQLVLFDGPSTDGVRYPSIQPMRTASSGQVLGTDSIENDYDIVEDEEEEGEEEEEEWEEVAEEWEGPEGQLAQDPVRTPGGPLPGSNKVHIGAEGQQGQEPVPAAGGPLPGSSKVHMGPNSKLLRDLVHRMGIISSKQLSTGMAFACHQALSWLLVGPARPTLLHSLDEAPLPLGLHRKLVEAGQAGASGTGDRSSPSLEVQILQGYWNSHQGSSAAAAQQGAPAPRDGRPHEPPPPIGSENPYPPLFPPGMHAHGGPGSAPTSTSAISYMRNRESTDEVVLRETIRGLKFIGHNTTLLPPTHNHFPLQPNHILTIPSIRVAMLISGPTNFACNAPDEPMGALFTSMQLLEGLGWRSVVLQTDVWMQMDSGRERQVYLIDLLRQAGGIRSMIGSKVARGAGGGRKGRGA